MVNVLAIGMTFLIIKNNQCHRLKRNEVELLKKKLGTKEFDTFYSINFQTTFFIISIKYIM